MWFPTLWLYFVPLPRPLDVDGLGFWLGLLFVTWPLNFIVYGWNDTLDASTDALNPRKGSYLFGARPTAEQRQVLPRYVGLTAALCSLGLLAYVWHAGGVVRSLLLLTTLSLIGLSNWLYNNAWGGLKQHPPFELLAQVGYLLVIPTSSLLNDVPLPNWPVWLYLGLFAVQSHLIGEVMDIVPDAKSGRTTSATRLGVQRTKWLILSIVVAETLVITLWFDAMPLALMLGAACVWLVADMFWLYKDRSTYSLREMQLAGWGSNVLALLSAVYVWHSGCFAVN